MSRLVGDRVIFKRMPYLLYSDVDAVFRDIGIAIRAGEHRGF